MMKAKMMAGGGMMKKGYAAGGAMPMKTDPKTGEQKPAFLNKGGMTKMAAAGGMMSKMKAGGGVMAKMQAGGGVNAKMGAVKTGSGIDGLSRVKTKGRMLKKGGRVI